MIGNLNQHPVNKKGQRSTGRCLEKVTQKLSRQEALFNEKDM